MLSVQWIVVTLYSNVTVVLDAFEINFSAIWGWKQKSSLVICSASFKYVFHILVSLHATVKILRKRNKVLRMSILLWHHFVLKNKKNQG